MSSRGMVRLAARRLSIRSSGGTALRLLSAGGGTPGIPTVYVTGFLTNTSCTDHWRTWVATHQRCVDKLNWSDEMYGLDWSTGAEGDWLGRWPVPLTAAISLALRRSSPQFLAAGVATDAIANAARLYLHFTQAQRSAAASAPDLAESLRMLCGDSGTTRSYRMVAHSLGCRLVMEARCCLLTSDHWSCTCALRQRLQLRWATGYSTCAIRRVAGYTITSARPTRP